ncbi:hypothetical protein GOBAR_AA14290 [Gossypium barbadense]|uniref:Uncharacterized protein n=1 Tax=Gossypium barbadense TaxID=3634 RepID=A0A2P5XSP9_GOSBA|nr:hypothetical protein GOBAR_AA14290 [Gossypium barbadense]
MFEIGIGFSLMFALLKPTFSLPLRLLPLTRRKSARSVSYYALFQGWLLLGKLPGCLCTPTPFITERGHLGALVGDPGCFPLDDEAYRVVSLADLDPCYFDVISSIQNLPR